MNKNLIESQKKKTREQIILNGKILLFQGKFLSTVRRGNECESNKIAIEINCILPVCIVYINLPKITKGLPEKNKLGTYKCLK